MLHFETIETKTLGLLRKLMQAEKFKELRLAWGTSLALQIGHYGQTPFNSDYKFKMYLLTMFF